MLITSADIFVGATRASDGGTIRIERTTLCNDDMIKIKLVEDGKIVLVITALLDHGQLIDGTGLPPIVEKEDDLEEFLSEFKPGGSV